MSDDSNKPATDATPGQWVQKIALDQAQAEIERLRRQVEAMDTEHRAWHQMADKAIEAQVGRDAAIAGKCLKTIPNTVIACGEIDSYCSRACHLLALLKEAYKELSTIEAITISPSDTDGLIDLCRRMEAAIKP